MVDDRDLLQGTLLAARADRSDRDFSIHPYALLFAEYEVVLSRDYTMSYNYLSEHVSEGCESV